MGASARPTRSHRYQLRHIDLQCWTPVRVWEMGCHQCTPSSHASTQESNMSLGGMWTSLALPRLVEHHRCRRWHQREHVRTGGNVMQAQELDRTVAMTSRGAVVRPHTTHMDTEAPTAYRLGAPSHKGQGQGNHRIAIRPSSCLLSLRGYPETFSHCCSEIKQHSYGNETQCDRRDTAC
jgi:hypothetical protein